MATLDQAIETFGKRHHYPPEKARTEAERRMNVEIANALAGDMTAIDRVPDELRQFARDRYEERWRAGEGAPGVVRFSGTTGLRL
jgi:hypothetical protein